MIKILFVCHGNICRSPMAEFIMKKMISESNLQDKVFVSSSATSDEALGWNIYSAAKMELDRHKIPYENRRAKQLSAIDYYKYDYIVVMDDLNMINIMKIFKGEDPNKKVKKLLSFAGKEDNIPDPWYTGNFSAAYDAIYEGCEGLLKTIKSEVFHVKQ